MAKRSLDAKADIKIRLTEGLRRNIEKAATQNGVSMNSEMIHRLERSFSQDDAFGSRYREFVRLMSAAFATAGHAKASEKKIAGDWSADADCYLAAAIGVVEALTLASPRSGVTVEHAELLAKSISGRLITKLINR